jgi:hypothetical protein
VGEGFRRRWTRCRTRRSLGSASGPFWRWLKVDGITVYEAVMIVVIGAKVAELEVEIVENDSGLVSSGIIERHNTFVPKKL